MRQILAAFVLIVSCGAAQAQGPSQAAGGVPGAIAALKAAIKDTVTWSAANAQTADVTCDGKPDIVLFGAGKTAGKETVWVAVVPGKGKPLAMEFPVSRSLQNGFCHMPEKISIKPIFCETDVLGHLDGCEPVKACKEFAVEDGECNPFNFYWDVRIRTIRSWRK